MGLPSRENDAGPSPSASSDSPPLVTCPCNHCPGTITFSPNEAGQVIDCPYCGMATKLYSVLPLEPKHQSAAIQRVRSIAEIILAASVWGVMIIVLWACFDYDGVKNNPVVVKTFFYLSGICLLAGFAGEWARTARGSRKASFDKTISSLFSLLGKGLVFLFCAFIGLFLLSLFLPVAIALWPITLIAILVVLASKK